MAELVTSFLLGFVVFLIYICFWKLSIPKKLPPGPRILPFIGNVYPLFGTKDVLKSFHALRRKYGDLFTLTIGGKYFVVVNGYDTFREIFIDKGDFVSIRPDNFMSNEMTHGNGIVFSSGHRWKVNRTSTLSLLRKFGFGKKSFEENIMKEVDIIINIFKQKAEKPIRAITSDFMTLSIANIMCDVTLGKQFDWNDQDFLTILNSIHGVASNVNTIGILTVFPFLAKVPGDPFRGQESLTHSLNLEKSLTKYIQEHLQTYDETHIRDFIDAYIREMKREGKVDKNDFDEQLLEIAKDLLVAGTETSANTMRWFILYMITHPKAQTRMRQEILDVIGFSTYPSMDHKDQMPYAEAVLNETLRLSCISPLSLPHGLTKDVRHGEFTIPKEAVLIPNISSILFDSTIFENPYSFSPERFLDENGQLNGKEKYVLSFSVGRRMCLGEALARMELFLFMTSLIQQFEFLPESESSAYDLQGSLGLICTPMPYCFIAKELSNE
uniref:Cytochrome P450 2B19-like isoform X2 n=1 Tax=Crassostrea virginica TaxID=6565 RepID=A0A8B8DBV7_CRAVI|nr:cytochrome P450 2B19-like isoform X2 [Crassostrea virginica]